MFHPKKCFKPFSHWPPKLSPYGKNKKNPPIKNPTNRKTATNPPFPPINRPTTPANRSRFHWNSSWSHGSCPSPRSISQSPSKSSLSGGGWILIVSVTPKKKPGGRLLKRGNPPRFSPARRILPKDVVSCYRFLGHQNGETFSFTKSAVPVNKWLR